MMMMVEKFKLDEDSMFDYFFEDAILMGIVAPQRDYMFIWNINQILNFKFRSSKDVDISLKKKGREYVFNIFEYSLPLSGTEHFLYENQHEGEYLLPEFKNLDFIWLMRGSNFSANELQDFMALIKQHPMVQMITEVPLEKVKNKKNLVY